MNELSAIPGIHSTLTKIKFSIQPFKALDRANAYFNRKDS